MVKVIATKEAPAAVGTYSQAISANGMLFVSGQLGLNPQTGAFAGEDFKSQAEQSLKNIGAILKSEGLTFANVVKVSVFLDNINDFAALNEVYAKYFVEPYPARSAVAVKSLPKGGLVEIEVIAAY
ncbi:MAG: RidA family protein [Bacteroidales bacterium]|nr:RidA family protein [Bacteroidales bacterium]